MCISPVLGSALIQLCCPSHSPSCLLALRWSSEEDCGCPFSHDLSPAPCHSSASLLAPARTSQLNLPLILPSLFTNTITALTLLRYISEKQVSKNQQQNSLEISTWQHFLISGSPPGGVTPFLLLLCPCLGGRQKRKDNFLSLFCCFFVKINLSRKFQEVKAVCFLDMK